jgi:hypothetical protein
MKAEFKNNTRRLTTWKEIASYLDVTIKTCKRWEEDRNLPVYRFKQSLKSRVYAYEQELDDWHKNQGISQNSKRRKIKKKLFDRKKIFYALIFPVALCLVLTFLIILRKNVEPNSFFIQDGKLIVNNRSGRFLWDYDPQKSNLCDYEDYKLHYDHKIKNLDEENYFSDWNFPLIKIKDINADGHNEVLFSVQTDDDSGENLICLDYHGHELWTFEPGREIKFGEKIFSNDYSIKGFDTVDFEQDGEFEIVIFSNHNDDFPTQVTVFNSKGRQIGEYMNAGRIMDYITHDLNGDGIKELILGGMNNEYTMGCVIVFDSRNIHGISPQLEKKYLNTGLEEGTQLHYLLLPRTDVDKQKIFREKIVDVKLRTNKKIRALAQMSGIYFEFDFDLQNPVVTISDKFRNLYREAKTEGSIKTLLSNADDYEKALAKNVLYWDKGDSEIASEDDGKDLGGNSPQSENPRWHYLQ